MAMCSVQLCLPAQFFDGTSSLSCLSSRPMDILHQSRLNRAVGLGLIVNHGIGDIAVGIKTSNATNTDASKVTVLPMRLQPRIEQKNGYWVFKEGFRGRINPQEKIKLERDPMKLLMENEIEELAKKPFAEIDSSKPGKDDVDVRLKWLGLFHRRKHQWKQLNTRKLKNCVLLTGHIRGASILATELGCWILMKRSQWRYL